MVYAVGRARTWTCGVDAPVRAPDRKVMLTSDVISAITLDPSESSVVDAVDLLGVLGMFSVFDLLGLIVFGTVVINCACIASPERSPNYSVDE